MDYDYSTLLHRVNRSVEKPSVLYTDHLNLSIYVKNINTLQTDANAFKGYLKQNACRVNHQYIENVSDSVTRSIVLFCPFLMILIVLE